jgi:hypothetical protein
MPKTKFQGIIFTMMMVFAMVFVMTVYNISMETGGLKYATFGQAIIEMWPVYIFAFLIENFMIGPLAKKLAFRIVSPKEDKPIFVILATSSFMVSLMAPTMSMFTTIVHHGFVIDLPVLWLTAVFKNFPMALCIQTFFVGPLVRLIFRNIFKHQLANGVQKNEVSQTLEGKVNQVSESEVNPI